MTVNDYNESILLLDEALIDAESAIQREVQPGEKSDCLMEPDRDKPWEYCGSGMSKCVCLYGIVRRNQHSR